MPKFSKKYEGEEFVISGEDGECTLKITHQESGRFATVSPGREGEGRFAYRLDNGLGWQVGTPEGAVDSACKKIIELLHAPKREEACDELHKYLLDNGAS